MFFVVKRKKLLIVIVIIFSVLSTYMALKTISLKPDNLSVSDSEENNVNELSPGDVITVSSNKSNYFLKAKSEKELVRSKTTEMLKSIIDDNSSSDKAVSDAENAIISIAFDMNMEQKIESLLAAKGFNETVVYITDNLTTITIKSNSLNEDDVAKINDIASSITGNNNVKIVEVEWNMWYNNLSVNYIVLTIQGGIQYEWY